MAGTAILDIDGTLVDTNYQHALAWYRAFRQNGIVLPVWRIHRHIGMGGDQMIAALTDKRTDEEKGDEIRAAEKALYMSMIEEVEPMDGTRDLIERLKAGGYSVVLASSAKESEVDHYLDRSPTSRPSSRSSGWPGECRASYGRRPPGSRPISRATTCGRTSR